MKTVTLSVILAFIDLLLVRSLGFGISEKNRESVPNPRILNGGYANTTDFQFMVHLRHVQRSCGGAVIANHFIVTVAHCVYDINCTTIEIFPSTWQNGQVAKIHAFQCYGNRQYLYPDFFYDISIIKTKEDLTKTGEYKVIPLPAPGVVFAPGTKAVLFGWGMTEDGSWPSALMGGEVSVVNYDACNVKYKAAAPLCLSGTFCSLKDIPRTVMCTQGDDPKPPGTCFGDSGGPLVVYGVLAGLIIGTVLEDNKCGIGLVTLHSNIVYYIKWIYTIIDPSKNTTGY